MKCLKMKCKYKKSWDSRQLEKSWNRNKREMGGGGKMQLEKLKSKNAFLTWSNMALT